MGIVEILLIILGLLNLIFAGYLLFYGERSLSAFFYALIAVFASIWSIATLLLTVHTISPTLFKISASGHYIFGYLAYLSFFWFTVFYPFPLKKILLPATLVSIGTTILLFFIPFSDYFFQSVQQQQTLSESIHFNIAGYIFFVVTLSMVFFSGLVLLLWKVREVKINPVYAHINQQQILYALLANFAAGSLGIVLNLVFPLAENFLFFSISPIFVIVSLLAVGLVNLIKFKLFNARVILAELFTVGIWIMFLARLLVSSDVAELQVNSLFFAGAIGFGFFLIKSVRAEVKALDVEEKLAHDLEISNKRLHDLDQQKNEFLSFASHQLRTPLTAIKWSAGAILDGVFGDVKQELKESVQTIFDESSLMGVFINDYLNVSRIEQGRMEYRFIPTNMIDVVKTTTAQMEPAIHQKSLTLTTKYESGTAMIWGDASKLTQVISNLIDNAIKYTPKGVITVSVCTLRKEGKVRVEITDTGIGMDTATLSKVFDKFSRGENAKEVNTAGSGLGLFIVRTFVEAHKGKVWIESEGVDKGSRFIVELPLFVQQQIPKTNA